MANRHGAEHLSELAARTEGLQPWRRLLHLVGGSLVAWVVYTLSPHSPTTRVLLGSALAVVFLVDAGRLRSEALNRVIFRTFGALLCPREVERLSLTWFLLGVFLVLWFPGERIAVASILVLSLADPAAGVVGRTWGTHPLGKGTLEGTVTFFLVAVAVLTPFVGIAAALPVAAVVSGAEAASTRLDDNTVIPVVAAIGLWIVTVVA